MWRFPQQLRIEPVMDRVVVFVGDEWDRCEWCFERMGVPARHEGGGWQFVCPVCAEPWLHVTYGPGLKAMAGDLGGLWWFRGPSGGRRAPGSARQGGVALACQRGRWLEVSYGLG